MKKLVFIGFMLLGAATSGERKDIIVSKGEGKINDSFQKLHTSLDSLNLMLNEIK